MNPKTILLVGILFLAPLDASAHGKEMILATSDEVAIACGGTSLTPWINAPKTGTIRWMKSVRADSSTAAFVGFDRVKTNHGYFVTATCLSPALGTTEAVTLMRAMPDEVKTLRAIVQKPKWWKELPTEYENILGVALHRSVRKVAKEYSGHQVEKK